jgi:hypothetical protein
MNDWPFSEAELWLVNSLAFPFDMNTDKCPPFTTPERLAAIWAAQDGSPVEAYLSAIYEETGWTKA